MLSKSKIRVGLHQMLPGHGEQKGTFDRKRDGKIHKRDASGLESMSTTHLEPLSGAGGQSLPRVKHEILELSL